ncbi:MAG: fimbrial protein [Tannerellaceae bacterium]
MRNVFQALIISTIASVMYSCSNGDVDSINLPDDVLQKGELQINVKSDSQTTESNSDATIKNLHFFVFKNKDGQDDHGKREIHQSKDSLVEGVSSVFSSEPTKGYKDLVVVANYKKTKSEVLSETGSLTEFYKQKAFLSVQGEGDFTMVGEQRFEVKGGLNETTVNLTRLVSKVVLKSVSVVADLQDSIKPVRAFMMNVNGVAWLRGTTTGSAECDDPIFHGYINEKELEEGYLAQLSSAFTSPATSSTFYTFENSGATAKTMLCIEAEYLKKSGEKVPVYYSIVVKTGDEAKVLRNNVYTLSATIKRPGSLHPEIPSDHGDLEVSITVDEWDYNLEQEESFE